MKLNLLILSLFIALCTAVSKSHLKLKTLATQRGGAAPEADSDLSRWYSPTNPNPAYIQAVPPFTFRAIEAEIFTDKQRIKIDNGQGLTYTWERDGKGNKIGEEQVEVSDEGYTWAVAVEYEQDGSWKPSLMKLNYVNRPHSSYVISARNSEETEDDSIEDAKIVFVF